MSTITGISSSTYGLTGADPSSAATITTGTQKTLNQDDFLKLLAQQFQSQDPMKPMDDTSFISQMAQFTSLQQTNEMSATLTAMQADSERATANSYLGHNVTVDAGNGATATGDVTAIDQSGTAPMLIVNGNSYALSAVIRVEPSAVSTNSASNATGA